MATKKRHPDGSACLEGTRAVPRGWTACCETFAGHTLACVFDIRYEWSKRREWGIAISETAGGGYIGIRFCPHCGARL